MKREGDGGDGGGGLQLCQRGQRMMQQQVWIMVAVLWFALLAGSMGGVATASSASSSSLFTVPTILSSHMVLQAAPQTSRLWGGATPSSPVWATLINNSTGVTVAKLGVFADPTTGNWSIDLPPQPASSEPYSLVILSEADADNVTFDDVVFGEVWFCAGQSNMEFSVNNTFGGPQVVRESSDYPLIRMFIQERINSTTPLTTTTSRNPNVTGWGLSSPLTVDGPSFQYYSAICYLYGRNVFHALGGRTPVGLVQSSWSGTAIEAWMSPEAYRVCPDVPNGHDDDASLPLASPSEERIGSRVGTVHLPSTLWNGMLAPFVPLRFRGFVWYQGEQNEGNYTSYACRFPVFIEDVREKWLDDFPFLFVLLAPHVNDSTLWPLIREAQLVALNVPLTYVASAQDVGDPASPFGDAHSRNKSIVSDRLSDIAQSQVYGNASVQWRGPSVVDIVWPVSDSPQQTVLLRLDPTDVASHGLHLLDTAECDLCCADLDGSPIQFDLSDGTRRRAHVQALPDLAMIAATIQLDDRADNASSDDIAIVALYQAWDSEQQCAIYNAARLPMLPFREQRIQRGAKGADRADQ